MPKVSIIVTAHNYGEYLEQCLDSALGQHHDSFEVVVADDGSTDNTPEVLRRYEGRVTVLRLSGVGLAAACNAAIRASSGEYIVRLDADDFFDENLLLVEANVLDRRSDVHLVYPDYYRVSASGEILEVVRLPKVYEEVRLLDRSALAIGAMYRRHCYDTIGGYDEELTQQEDYDFWLRFVDRFRVHNVNVPLMYYRQHERSMSLNRAGQLAARRTVKRKFVERHSDIDGRRILAVVPAMAKRMNGQKLPLHPLAGRSVLSYVVHALGQTPLLDRVVVSTEDEEVAAEARRLGADVPFLRPAALARSSVSVESVVQQLVARLEEQEGYVPDMVAVAHVHSPFLRAEHVTEAIHTMAVYDTDSVISVTLDLTFHWKRGVGGLEPVGYRKRLLREEKDLVFKENGALYVARTELVRRQALVGDQVGHIEMLDQESMRLESPHSFWVAEQMLANGRTR